MAKQTQQYPVECTLASILSELVEHEVKEVGREELISVARGAVLVVEADTKYCRLNPFSSS